MSSKKDKLIEEAQRLAFRGQIDKAIKAYEQVVALDPSAVNQRQKLAELFVKAGRAEDARREFEAIGKAYSGSGFYLKAISVFKRLQVMFPQDIAITLNLAALNEKQGLAGNALAEYKRAYDYYEKLPNAAEALKILDRMQQVDKQNAGIKLKFAEACFQAGETERSYDVFFRLAVQVQEKGDHAAVNRLDARVRQLFPAKSGFMREVLAEQLAGGDAGGAIQGLQALLRGNPRDQRVWELLLEACQKLNQPLRLKAACQHYLAMFPREPSARKRMLDCLVGERDVEGALDLLGRYEADFISGAAAGSLVELYRALDQIQPSDTRILQGLHRALLACGDKEQAAALTLAIAALGPTSGEGHGGALTAGVADSGVAEQGLSPVRADGATAEAARAAGNDVPEVDGGDLAGEIPVASEPFGDQTEIEIEIELDENFDFDSLGPAPAPGTMPPHWTGPVDEIFDMAVTSRRSVKFGSVLDKSDAQTHYDLGVAFREMGLYDEAISEFRQASEDPARRLDCLVLQGACLRGKGDLTKAEGLFRSLLKQEAGLAATCLVKYELALVCEAAGKSEEAAKLLADVDAADPGFLKTRSRLDANGEEDALDFSDEDLKVLDFG